MANSYNFLFLRLLVGKTGGTFSVILYCLSPELTDLSSDTLQPNTRNMLITLCQKGEEKKGTKIHNFLQTEL